MLIIPAIDIKGGKCVRLFQGDFTQSTTYYNDPVDVAKMFKQAGAGLIHVIDLDGAKEGRLVNLSIVERIVKEVDIDIELGGGIRTEESVKKVLDAGVKWAILSTTVVEDISFLDKVKEYQQNLAISVDLSRKYLSTHGWMEGTDIHYRVFLLKLMEYNVKRIIVTDINRDGTLKGPNFVLYRKLADEFPVLNITVSGGISEMKDLEKISKMKKNNIDGIIIGKAIYEKTIDLEEALKYAG